jgi:TolB-like protein
MLIVGAVLAWPWLRPAQLVRNATEFLYCGVRQAARLSLVVLPFQNFSRNAELDHLADASSPLVWGELEQRPKRLP